LGLSTDWLLLFVVVVLVLGLVAFVCEKGVFDELKETTPMPTFWTLLMFELDEELILWVVFLVLVLPGELCLVVCRM